MLTRGDLEEIIAQCDTQNVITSRGILDTAGSCATSESGGSIATPSCFSLSLLEQSGPYNSLIVSIKEEASLFIGIHSLSPEL
jgi:hypothetical protein